MNLNVIYLEIGRGHPFYLDGVVKALDNRFNGKINAIRADVYSLSSGLSRSLWELIKEIYRRGSSGKVGAVLYRLARSRKSAHSYGLIQKALARDLRKYVKSNRCPTLVSHPLLVPMIADLTPVFYQHGEIAAPAEARVGGAKKIFVPIAQTMNNFIEAGIPAESLHESGLCVEPELAEKAEEYLNLRLKRYYDNSTLTGAFFSSGAEPSEHIKKIILACRAMQQAGQKGIIICKKGGRLEKEAAQNNDFRFCDPNTTADQMENIIKTDDIVVISFGNRREENNITCNLFRLFDYFAAPTHERTNWAAGLGLPMMALHPLIGPYSPLNLEFLQNRRLVVEIKENSDAARFPAILQKAKNEGALDRMARDGFGRFGIDGFNNIAACLAADLESLR
jgi:hypothetical protein